MKFIYFIDAALKELVLKKGIFLTPNQRKINKESSGIFCYPLIKIPFKCPVNEDDFDNINDYLDFKKKEQVLNESLSIEEAWEVVGASRVKRRDGRVKEVSGVIFELEPTHWPITVFIDIKHFIATEFANILDDRSNKGITFTGYKNSLLELVRKIEHKKYVIANASFTVNTEDDLLDLINKLKLSGGGIWEEDSFECMLTENVASKNIKQIIKLENKYYNSVIN